MCSVDFLEYCDTYKYYDVYLSPRDEKYIRNLEEKYNRRIKSLENEISRMTSDDAIFESVNHARTELKSLYDEIGKFLEEILSFESDRLYTNLDLLDRYVKNFNFSGNSISSYKFNVMASLFDNVIIKIKRISMKEYEIYHNLMIKIENVLNITNTELFIEGFISMSKSIVELLRELKNFYTVEFDYYEDYNHVVKHMNKTIQESVELQEENFKYSILYFKLFMSLVRGVMSIPPFSVQINLIEKNTDEELLKLVENFFGSNASLNEIQKRFDELIFKNISISDFRTELTKIIEDFLTEFNIISEESQKIVTHLNERNESFGYDSNILNDFLKSHVSVSQKVLYLFDIFIVGISTQIFEEKIFPSLRLLEEQVNDVNKTFGISSDDCLITRKNDKCPSAELIS